MPIEVMQMIKPFTRKFEDNSNGREFSFTFFCDICQRPYCSSAISRAGIAKELRPCLRHSRRGAYRLALEKASYEARLHFNRCRRCAKWVCDDDFHMDSGLCAACLAEDGLEAGRKEQGNSN